MFNTNVWLLYWGQNLPDRPLAAPPNTHSLGKAYYPCHSANDQLFKAQTDQRLMSSYRETERARERQTSRERERWRWQAMIDSAGWSSIWEMSMCTGVRQGTQRMCVYVCARMCVKDRENVKCVITVSRCSMFVHITLTHCRSWQCCRDALLFGSFHTSRSPTLSSILLTVPPYSFALPAMAPHTHKSLVQQRAEGNDPNRRRRERVISSLFWWKGGRDAIKWKVWAFDNLLSATFYFFLNKCIFLDFFLTCCTF